MPAGSLCLEFFVSLQLLFAFPCSAINSLQLGPLFIASPVGACSSEALNNILYIVMAHLKYNAKGRFNDSHSSTLHLKQARGVLLGLDNLLLSMMLLDEERLAAQCRQRQD